MPWPERSLFLGVDGGGTKTCFVLIDGDGREVSRALAPSGYYLQIGLDALARTLGEGVAHVLDMAGADENAVRHAFFGLPALGEDSARDPALLAAAAAALGHGRHVCGNDMICGWAGSLGGDDGISVTAGTGSIGYGERRGRAARAGGWGELFSDEGSAHWIARGALALFSRMSDGRLSRGPLYDIVRAHFALEHDLDLCARTLGEGAGRDRIAALSEVAARAAEAGDREAAALFRHAARELAAIAEAIRAQLGYEEDEPTPLSYSGGVFKAGALVLPAFEEALAELSPGYRLRRPLHDPGVGAALYARRLADRAG